MSDFVQSSFLGGMNLLSEDTRLQPNQYRVGFNLRNRYDVLQPVKSSVLNTTLPEGIVQEMTTFGEFEIVFVSGKCYFKHYDRFAWTEIEGFAMSTVAERYWTVAVPLATTNYLRVSPEVESGAFTGVSSHTPLDMLQLSAAAVAGNVPGLLVQDNINQPQFLFINEDGVPEVRTTKNYEQWNVEYNAGDMVLEVDEREYVPIGNAMAWDGVVLHITAQDFVQIYHSVSGRPLDFMVNVTQTGEKGGDASTVAYSVGVGPITCLKVMSDGSLFVAAGNSNFAVSKISGEGVPLIFNEFQYSRKFLFEATCLSDRCIIDSLGDTRFIDLTGVRSFNAVLQLQNEGRNAPFTAIIQPALDGIIQSVAAAILFDNYEIYSLSTVYGNVLAVYDTLSGCWSSFDTTQTGGSAVKILAKIELGIQRLYAVTEDNKLYVLYSSEDSEIAAVVTASINATTVQGDTAVRLTNPEKEVKPLAFRCVINKITEDSTATLTPIVNNRVSATIPALVKTITYVAPAVPYSGVFNLPDIDSQLTNLYYPLPNCEQGWKASALFSWTGGGSLTQLSMSLRDESPMNPMQTQATTV